PGFAGTEAGEAFLSGSHRSLCGNRRTCLCSPTPNSVARDSAQASPRESVNSGGRAERHNQRARARRPGETEGHRQNDGSERGPGPSGQPLGHAGRVALGRTAGAEGLGAQTLSVTWTVGGGCLHPREARVPGGFGWAYLTLPPAEEKLGVTTSHHQPREPSGKDGVRKIFDPYGKNKFSTCRICKSSVHQPGSHYCQGCAYKKGICAMCGKKVLDTKNYKQTSV
uniref:Cysteine-rich PDZ-binding protein n=1 Tax=Ailuropoda melanoleuca TaxID=9646 RepID=A0A7N5KFL7_AILME